jgi:transposase
MGADPESFSGGAHCRWSSRAQADPTRRVLEAVLWLLNTGAQWHMLPQSYPNYKTVHRRFQAWCRDEILRRLLTDVANELRDPLDEELRRDGIEMIAPHRANRSKPPTQDRRRLTRYMRRWLVERFFAWIQWQRRILVRWEYHTQNFLGFVQLACLVILFRRF